MSADLERMFSSLRTDSDTATLSAPTALRRRGDRRVRARAVAGLITAAMLVSGTAIGARQLLAGAVAPVTPITHVPPMPPTPGSPPATASSSPSPTTPSASTPSAKTPPSTPSTRQPNAPGSAIPNLAFLHQEDTVFGPEVPADQPRGPYTDFPPVGAEYLPTPCSSGQLNSDSAISARRSGGYYVTHYSVDGPYPTMVDQTITQYVGDGAGRYLADLRLAIDRCPSVRRDGTTYRHRIVASGFAGDESMLISRTFLTRYAPEAPLNEATYYIAVVRVRDVVTVLYDQGWESSPSPRAEIETLADRAAVRLSQWRG